MQQLSWFFCFVLIFNNFIFITIPRVVLHLRYVGFALTRRLCLGRKPTRDVLMGPRDLPAPPPLGGEQKVGGGGGGGVGGGVATNTS